MPASSSSTSSSSSSSSSTSKRLIQRRRLDARVTGTLQDVLATQPIWEVVELNASSKLSLRLLEVLSHCHQVHSLILIDPCEAVQQFLAGWLVGNTPWMTLATIDHVSIRTGTMMDGTAEILRESLCRRSCRVTHFELCDVSLESWNVVQCLAQGLQSLQCLAKLSLRSCHLQDHELAFILQALPHHVTLKDLCLTKNYCQEQATMALAELLMSPTNSLQILDVSNQETWDDRRYYHHLARAVSNGHCQLKDLDLASNFIHDEQFIDLVEALQENNTRLESLNLRHNRITDVGMHHLVHRLPKLAITLLDISHNSYELPVVIDLENALKTQTVLLQLSIDHEEHCPLISYYLALNQSGRYCKSHSDFPLGLWSFLLEKCQRNYLDVKVPKMPEEFYFTAMDLVFDVLHGPVLLER